MDISIERKYDEVLHVRHSDWGRESEQTYLLISDVHWDNPHCDRRLLKRHLDQAIEADAGIMVFGDLLCLMQGKYDPRSNKADLRPEHRSAAYFDAVLDTAEQWFEPYADHMVMISDGNHETAVKKRHEFDILEALCRRLNVQHMGYSGFVKFMFSGKGGKRRSRNLYFDHGSGGGGPVTRNVIRSNRKAVDVPDAHIIVHGHVHQRWEMDIPRVRLSDSGRVYLDNQVHLQLSTYKQEYVMSGGYHVESGRGPKPLGGAWLTFRYDTHAPQLIGIETRAAR